MGKKDLFGAKVKNEVRKRIISELQAGKPRQQLLHELSEEYMDKQSLAGMISSKVLPEDETPFLQKNKLLYYLILLLGIEQFVLKLLFLLNIDWNKKWFLLPVAMIVPAFIFYFAHLVKKGEGYVYTLIIIFGLMGIANSAKQNIFDSTASTVFFLIHVSWILDGMFLANSISKQFFPHLRWKMPGAEKNGNYILSRKEMHK